MWIYFFVIRVINLEAKRKKPVVILFTLERIRGPTHAEVHHWHISSSRIFYRERQDQRHRKSQTGRQPQQLHLWRPSRKFVQIETRWSDLDKTLRWWQRIPVDILWNSAMLPEEDILWCVDAAAVFRTVIIEYYMENICERTIVELLDLTFKSPRVSSRSNLGLSRIHLCRSEGLAWNNDDCADMLYARHEVDQPQKWKINGRAFISQFAPLAELSDWM